MKNSHKKAFTLPEVIISISVMVMVIMSSTNLIVSIIRNNTQNQNTLIAYGLAQEGLEGVRNIRDSNWLLGADFTGNLNGKAVWGLTLPAAVNQVRYYRLDLNLLEPYQGAVQSKEDLLSATPWKLFDLTDLKNESVDDRETLGKNDKTLLYVDNDLLTGEVHYVHTDTGNKTPFHRYVVITSEPYTPIAGGQPLSKSVKMRVTSVVNWQELGRNREVRLDSELTDWRDN